MNRCFWVNINNPLYVKYHDEEWGKPLHDDNKLFEMLILEMFQAGLSWECILNKRKYFRDSFDNFDFYKIINYDDCKINELMQNENIIRNRRKLEATINNAKVYIDIINKHGSFDKYIWHFTNNKILVGVYKTENELSLKIANELKKMGMKFLGPTIIYSYLQAIGIINDHEENCIKYSIE